MSKQFTREDLEQYICEVMEIEAITPMIAKQINRLVLEKGMTWKEIARCICWYVEVNNKKLSIIYGISIVENFRIETAKYFKKLELDQQEQLRQAKKVVEYQDNNIIFNIKNLNLTNQKRTSKQLDFNDIQIEGDEDGNY
jgi:rRNA processing protein Krr1/Pno1